MSDQPNFMNTIMESLPKNGFEAAGVAAIDLGIGAFAVKTIMDGFSANVPLWEHVVAAGIEIPGTIIVGGFGIACAVSAARKALNRAR